MKERLTVLKLSNIEIGIVVRCMTMARNQLILEGQPTHMVDDLLMKTIHGPDKSQHRPRGGENETR